MVPRPSSPTSLLWAHQLRREHNILLDRIKVVEATSTKLTETVTSIESTRISNTNSIESLVTRVSACENNAKSFHDWTRKKLEEREEEEEEKEKEEVNQRLEKVQESCTKIAAETQEVAATCQLLANRVGSLETGQTVKANGEGLRKKDDPVDVRVLNRRLDAMEARRQQDDARTTALLSKVAALEASNQLLTEKNLELQREVMRLYTRPYEQPTASAGQSEEITETPLIPESSSVQVPQSPLVVRGRRSSIIRCGYPVEDSPAHDAQLRRSAKEIAQTGAICGKITLVGEMVDKTKDGAFAVPVNPKPSSRIQRTKRRASPNEKNVRVTRSRTRLNAKLGEIPSLTPSTMAGCEEDIQPLQEVVKTIPPSQKYKRREIIQVHDLDSFTSMANIDI